MRRPLTPAGTISPFARRASSANQRTYCAPMAISPLASASGLPISTVRSSASAAWLSISASCSFHKRPTRVIRSIPASFGKAAVAASMARIVSASPQAGTVPMTSPVAGFVTSIVLPLSAAIQSPATKFACFIQSCQSAMVPPLRSPCDIHPPFRTAIRHFKPACVSPHDPNRYANAWFPKRRVCSMDLARRNGICCGAVCAQHLQWRGRHRALRFPEFIDEDHDDWDGLCRPRIRGLFLGFRP
jgi:hypothetical protein